MLIKMAANDLRGKKTISLAVFSLVALSACLMAAGARIIVDLGASVAAMAERSAPPHFVQYHSGEADEAAIAAWSDGTGLVAQRQVVRMLNVDETELYFGEAGRGRGDSVMEAAFTAQNRDFDLLLDMENRPLRLAPGEVALPVFYMQRYGLSAGDTLSVRSAGYRRDFTIVSALRDFQMNAPVVSSKRILVSDQDFAEMDGRVGRREHLIEFRLNDPERMGDFADAYGRAKLPAKGPAIDQDIMRVLNGLTDGLVAGLVIFTSLVLAAVAGLCLRFTIIAAVEDDYREIGVLKALGLTASRLRRLYGGKYALLLGVSCAAGYLLSLPASSLFMANVMAYLGKPPESALRYAAPALAAACVFLLLTWTCLAILGRFKRISAVEALRLGRAGDGKAGRRIAPLYRRRLLGSNACLALAELASKPAAYALLFAVFAAAAFIVAFPANLLGTVRSPSFISYMGMGRSDVLIDLRQGEDVLERYAQVLSYLEGDADVERYSPLVTCKYDALNAEGILESMTVETGDFSIFPLEYAEGRAPDAPDEIALSVLNARDSGLSVGGTLTLRLGGEDRPMRVTGIYQDVTNGGKTAKARIEPDYDRAAWFLVAVGLAPEARGAVASKTAKYAAAFGPARITDVRGYLDQTFGATIVQMERMAAAAQGAAILVTILITALFLKMMLSKEKGELAVQKALGFSAADLTAQYLHRILALLLPALAAGVAAAKFLGEGLAGAALSLIGASKIVLVVDPVRTILVYPAVFIILATAVTLLVTASVKNIESSGLSVE